MSERRLMNFINCVKTFL